MHATHSILASESGRLGTWLGLDLGIGSFMPCPCRSYGNYYGVIRYVSSKFRIRTALVMLAESLGRRGLFRTPRLWPLWLNEQSLTKPGVGVIGRHSRYLPEFP